MLSHIGVVVAVGFIAASAFMNYLFGYSLGRSPVEAHIYGIVGLLAVIANATSPFFAHAAYKAQRLPTLYAIVAFWLLCLAYSLTSALGFAAENRQAIAALKAAMHDVLYTKLQTLRDLEARKRTLAIETRIHALREEINVLRTRGATNEADPQTAMLAKLIGVDRQTARTLLLILFALMVEAGAAIGLFAALSTEPLRSSPEAAQKSPRVNGKVWNPSKKPSVTRM